MKIKWYGHASFKLTSDSGTTIITDPYRSGAFNGAVKYEPIDEPADVVTVSHQHADHNDVEGIPGNPILIDKAESIQIDDVTINGIACWHDSQKGSRRGENIVFCYAIDNLKICHLGDLGHILTDGRQAEMGKINVLLIPVGGVFTIDADQATGLMERLLPNVTVPMHYSNSRCSINIDPVDKFLTGKNNVNKIPKSEIELSADNLPAEPVIVVPEPAR